MRNQIRLFVLIGGGSVALGAGVLVACSSDTSVDSGGQDGGSDVVITPIDANTGDSPSSDAGADAPFDGGFQVSTFDTVLATEMCRTLARCCYGNPTPPAGGADGGTFDVASCITQFGRLGFESSNAGAELKDGGKVVLDQVSADSCIKKIQALSCNLPGPEFDQVRSACFGAYSGTGVANAACQDSIECQQGFFCQGAGDAGGGSCKPLRAAGQPCGDFTTDPVAADQACSYRGGGGSGNYCNFYDVPSGTFTDAGSWACTPAGGAGSNCAANDWCIGTICSFDTLKCETPNRYLDGTCTKFLVP